MGDTRSGMVNFSALPPIAGTPKQFDWATQIRGEIAEAYGKIYADFMSELQRLEVDELNAGQFLGMSSSSLRTLEGLAGVMRKTDTMDYLRHGEAIMTPGERRRINDGTYNLELSKMRVRITPMREEAAAIRASGQKMGDAVRDRTVRYARALEVAARARVQTETRAEWWIDNRSLGGAYR